MKRSEFLDKLAFLIATSSSYTGPVSHYLNENILADEILYLTKELGMMPPARIGALVGLDGIPIHAWEPEEEVVPNLPFGASNVGFVENLHTGSELIGLECPVIKNYNRPDFDIFD
jgi:hypothetical protein